MVNWAVLSDEQTSKGWPFSLLNDEQMSNKVRVEHQPVNKPLIRPAISWGKRLARIPISTKVSDFRKPKGKNETHEPRKKGPWLVGLYRGLYYPVI